ncbi:axonemal dynein light chain domain-containing protein 1 isoform X8 [Heterodontus francisci]|uniref:axonemal dynein light chain domain-containing protein 1 isoform X8 n=1 Tax=Heterodontus francisci TaxID=7792 RepID=UPI00355C127A
MCDAVHEDVSPVVPNPNKDSSELTSNVCIDLKEQPESTPTSEQMLNICACFGERAKSGESDQSDSDTCMHLKEQTELHKQKNMPHAIDQHPTTSLQNDFIPEEILLALTTVTNSCCHDEPLGPLKKNRTPKDPKGYRTKLHRIRPTDHVWHHPTRRTRFKYLIDQPVSLAQAGRDISFLCDAVYSKCPEQLVPAISITRDKSAVRAQLEKQHATKELDVPESLIPDEYHIVKNKGVLGLEYYDDKYTTLLQDREKKLRIFPSMKPSGRVEAIQLSQVMDAMLEKVGFNEDNEPKLKGETQMHHLLDLVKKEQDIYNIVFHELIRQISVDCAERGELLAKISMLDEYHHLYELQRKRLIAQVGALTQEKDWWSEAAYSLALKVIEEKNLKLVHDLEVCEKLWVKIAQHFAVMLGTKDAEDQTKLQEITAHWREQIIKFNKNIEHAENSSLEKRELILSGFKKWHKYFSEKIASPRGIKSFPKDMLYMLRNDLKDWHELITQDYERYEGSLFSTTQEALFDIVQLHNDWIDLSLTLFERHQWSMDEKIPEQIAMEELSSTVGTLSQHYTIMLTGENGIIEIILCTAWHLMKLQDMLESCRVKFDFANMEEIGSVEFDLLKLHEKFPTLIKLLEDAMNLAATPQTEEEKMNKQPYVSSSLQLGEVIHKMQDWLLTLFKMITHKDTKLTQQIAIIQSAMSHLLVDLLLYMVLDPAANTRKTYFKHLSTPDTPAKLEEKALMVASELNILSTQMYRWCKDIVEALVKQRAAMHLHDPDNELKELEKLKVECTEWINICEILLSEIKQQPVQLLSARNENVLSQINLTRDLCTACLRGSATNILGMTDSELSVLLPEESQSVDGPTTISSFQRLMTTEVTETAESVTVQVAEDVTETGQSSQLLKSTENTDGADGIKDVEDHSLLMEKGQAFQSHSKAILKYIGDDTNIHERDLKETTVPIAKVNIDAVVPTNPKSVKAYEELTSMGMLQQQLIETELRALNAEERATSLDDSLQEALDKIKDLTLELQTKEAKDELQQPEKSSLPTRTISARSVVKVAKPTSAKTKSTKSTRAKIKK